MKIGTKTILPIPEVPTEVEMETGTLRDLCFEGLSKNHLKADHGPGNRGV